MQVNPDDGAAAFIPTVAVDSHGDLGISYYQFTGGVPSPGSTDVWLDVSGDGGVSFQPREHLYGFDMHATPVTPDGSFVGDYQGRRWAPLHGDIPLHKGACRMITYPLSLHVLVRGGGSCRGL